MEKLNKEECNNLSGGFAISAIITSILGALPLVFSTVASTASLIKSLSASKGEIKTKDFSAKWENEDNKMGFNVGFHYCV
ncbi:hypothetical protein MAU_3120 [Metamycoplasma auris 15026]|uniref:Bacteriocin n=1 Tax=Metamycoplasma auris 15026 TaxID=1188233 RepID=N9V083_9BACT|nr:hypothetical protein [Metamycoplasma auris]ENY68827.1 hypothetical protein MAU_3120 [Metamycoplasma auris 15026]